MQLGKVETTGKNVGGLIGYMHPYNVISAAYIHHSYAILQNSFASGEVIGSLNAGGLIGNAYRQCTYNHTYQNAYLQITNSYAIGKVTSTGEVGGLIGQLASTYNGSTTTTNSYWTPETTVQEESKAGIRKNIQTMLYSSGYITWDFDNIWTIDEGLSIAYLKNVVKPAAVNKENISYLDFNIEGAGTENNPYLIKNAVQLQKINENLAATYKLVNDIELTGTSWIPIGDQNYPFKGTLDGNGYTISNLTLNRTEDNSALFGYSSGTIKSIKLNNFNITGTNYAATLAAWNVGTMIDCEIVNSNVSGTSYIGGLVGNNAGDLTNGTFSGIVSGTGNYVGGLIGSSSGNITESSAQATVTGTNSVGGLIGYAYVNNNNSTIESSSSKGSVQGTTNVGGLIGAEFIYHTYAADSVTYTMYLKKSYSTASVTGTGDNVGGLVGYQQSGINVSNHYEYAYSYIQECYATRKSRNYR